MGGVGHRLRRSIFNNQRQYQQAWELTQDQLARSVITELHELERFFLMHNEEWKSIFFWLEELML